MDTVKIDKKQTKMIAHRGLSGIERENSNAAFVAAGNRSYFGIETDVHVTADGKFIIIHDDVTGRVGNRDVSVENSSFEELRAIYLKGVDANNTPKQDLILPTLEDYIEICRRYNKVSVLELKNPMKKENIEGIIDVIKNLGHLDMTVFISFDLNNLLIIKEILPRQRTMLLCCEVDDSTVSLLAEKCIDIDICYPSLFKNPDLLEKLKAAGLSVNCWTCDSKDDAERLADMGVDFITSNILE